MRQGWCAEVGNQLAGVIFPPSGSWGSDSGHLNWWQVFSSTEPSWQPWLGVFSDRVEQCMPGWPRVHHVAHLGTSLSLSSHLSWDGKCEQPHLCWHFSFGRKLYDTHNHTCWPLFPAFSVHLGRSGRLWIHCCVFIHSPIEDRASVAPGSQLVLVSSAHLCNCGWTLWAHLDS